MRLCLPVLSVVLTLGACAADEEEHRTLAPYAPRTAWVTECLGRYVVDVPDPINLGAARAKHSGIRGQHNVYGSGERNDPAGGSVNLVQLDFLESVPLRKTEQFRDVWGYAEAAYEIDVIRDGGPIEERPRRAKETQRHPLPNNAFIWRHKNTVDFGILLEVDMRARMLQGPLSGEGSLSQARAVIDHIWPRYRPRKPGEIPKEPGICTPYGFLADPADSTERDHDISLAFRHPSNPNLVIRVDSETRNPQTQGVLFSDLGIKERPTPWDQDRERARKSSEQCRTQQGTASRDLFGCTFAGARDIRRWREVQYFQLPDGQTARLLAYEHYTGLNGDLAYTVALETAGERDAPNAPALRISASGYAATSERPSMAGREPPWIEDAIRDVLRVAASLRPRTGAIRAGAPVRDSLEGIR